MRKHGCLKKLLAKDVGQSCFYIKISEFPAAMSLPSHLFLQEFNLGLCVLENIFVDKGPRKNPKSNHRTTRFAVRPIAVADLRGAINTTPSPRLKSFSIPCVFLREGEIWQNRMLAPLLENCRPLLRGILDPPLHRM